MHFWRNSSFSLSEPWCFSSLAELVPIRPGPRRHVRTEQMLLRTQKSGTEVDGLCFEELMRTLRSCSFSVVSEMLCNILSFSKSLVQFLHSLFLSCDPKEAIGGRLWILRKDFHPFFNVALSQACPGKDAD